MQFFGAPQRAVKGQGFRSHNVEGGAGDAFLKIFGSGIRDHKSYSKAPVPRALTSPCGYTKYSKAPVPRALTRPRSYNDFNLLPASQDNWHGCLNI